MSKHAARQRLLGAQRDAQNRRTHRRQHRSPFPFGVQFRRRRRKPPLSRRSLVCKKCGTQCQRDLLLRRHLFRSYFKGLILRLLIYQSHILHFIDNKACVDNITSRYTMKNTKYMQVKYSWIRDCVKGDNSLLGMKVDLRKLQRDLINGKPSETINLFVLFFLSF